MEDIVEAIADGLADSIDAGISGRGFIVLCVVILIVVLVIAVV
jgi:hypothetical protein